MFVLDVLWLKSWNASISFLQISRSPYLSFNRKRFRTKDWHIGIYVHSDKHFSCKIVEQTLSCFPSDNYRRVGSERNSLVLLESFASLPKANFWLHVNQNPRKIIGHLAVGHFFTKVFYSHLYHTHLIFCQNRLVLVVTYNHKIYFDIYLSLRKIKRF